MLLTLHSSRPTRQPASADNEHTISINYNGTPLSDTQLSSGALHLVCWKTELNSQLQPAGTQRRRSRPISLKRSYLHVDAVRIADVQYNGSADLRTQE
jgi:hypothetical protein